MGGTESRVEGQTNHPGVGIFFFCSFLDSSKSKHEEQLKLESFNTYLSKVATTNICIEDGLKT